ncbi:hypothetical protein [Streptomyces sp. cg35]|uniref:hypothetical protein n=1 Tax=Streptomyces sp. cg35 TaxID=3421650 RepID=UPI003D17D780
MSTAEETSAPEGLSCTACGTTVPRPPHDGRSWAPLWDAGWRWLGSLRVFSCPACPPVVLVDADGRHRRAPAVQAR